MPDPTIIAIDDDVNQAESLLEDVFETADGRVISSTEIEQFNVLEEIAAADLVVVDYNLLDLADAVPPGARNGLALISVLREHLANQERQPSFVLLSNKLNELSDLPQDTRAHVLARTQNFEWALTKDSADSNVTLSEALLSLAAGSQTIGARFPFSSLSRPREENLQPDNAGKISDATDAAIVSTEMHEEDLAVTPGALRNLRELLKIPTGTSWSREASRQAEMARPPIYSAAAGSLAVPIRRWLLHRIIPYPTFLYGVENVAARLGLSISTLTPLLEGELADVFHSARYRGVYCDLDGPRYWRIGVEQLVEELGHGDMHQLQTALQHTVGRSLPFVDHPRPVVVLNQSWTAEDLPVAPSQAIRVQLDDWPAHAEPARVRLERLDDPAVASMVLEADRSRSAAPRGQS